MTFGVQTSYGLYPPAAIAGQRYSSQPGVRSVTKVARGDVKPGRAMFRVPGYGAPGTNFLDPGEGYQSPSPAAAADVDAIVASGASAATEQTISGAGLTGVVGGTKMFPGRKFTLVLSNHADWDATDAVATYKRNGITYQETLAIPNGGNTTLTTASEGDEFVSWYIPAQSGTGGTFTAGIAALTAADAAGVLGFVQHVPSHEQDGVAGTGLIYADGEPVDVLEANGDIWVEAEEAMVPGDTVYVRVATGAGGSLLGKVRNDSDSSTCIALSHCSVIKYDSATGLVALFVK